jgi:hypothetical protein
MRYALSLGASDKRIRLHVDDNEGKGSWMIGTNHTEPGTTIRRFKLGLLDITKGGFVVHYDDVKYYVGAAGYWHYY